MSETLGPLAYGEREDSGFLGSNQRHKDYSEQTAQEIDDEVRRIVQSSTCARRDILNENRDKLDAIAEALLERETLDREEIEAIMRGEPLPERERIVIPTYAEKRRDGEGQAQGLHLPAPSSRGAIRGVTVEEGARREHTPGAARSWETTIRPAPSALRRAARFGAS